MSSKINKLGIFQTFENPILRILNLYHSKHMKYVYINIHQKIHVFSHKKPDNKRKSYKHCQNIINRQHCLLYLSLTYEVKLSIIFRYLWTMGICAYLQSYEA